jgi:hypothetical protein
VVVTVVGRIVVVLIFVEVLVEEELVVVEVEVSVVKSLGDPEVSSVGPSSFVILSELVSPEVVSSIGVLLGTSDELGAVDGCSVTGSVCIGMAFVVKHVN